MKTIRFLLPLVLISGAALFAADAPAPNYLPTATKLAVKFLRGEKTGEADQTDFYGAEEIVGDDFVAAVDAAIGAGRVIAKKGPPAKSKHFAELLAATLGAPAALEVAPPAVTVNVPTTATVKKDKPADAAAPSEVLAADQLPYDKLKVEERELNETLKAQQQIIAGAGTTADQKKAATLKRDATQDALNENLAGQTALRAKFAVDAATKAAAAAPDSTPAKTALADAKKQQGFADAAVAAFKTQNQKYDQVPEFTNTGPVSFIHGGVRLLSPYKFRFDATAGKGFLDKAGGSDTATFIEYVYANRMAWNPRWLSMAKDHDWARPAPSNFDLETRLTYNFSKSSTDATAIAGSGDFGAEVSVNHPFVFKLHDPANWAQGGWSLGPELSYSVTTERDTFDAHKRFFYGLGYTLSYNLDGKNTRWLLLQARLGGADVDSVTFLSNTSHEVEIANGDLPRYSPQRATAFETDVIYPLSKDSHLTFGGRVYAGPHPSAWTLYFGYTKSISDIAKALFPNLGEGDTPAAAPSAPSAASGAGPSGATVKPAAQRAPATPSL